MEEQVKQFILKHLNETLTPPASTESYLRDDLGQDSLDRVEMTMEIEKEFNIVISDDEVTEWKTVQDVIETTIKLIKA